MIGQGSKRYRGRHRLSSYEMFLMLMLKASLVHVILSARCVYSRLNEWLGHQPGWVQCFTAYISIIILICLAPLTPAFIVIIILVADGRIHL
jgi:hypothetical protein